MRPRMKMAAFVTACVSLVCACLATACMAGPPGGDLPDGAKAKDTNGLRGARWHGEQGALVCHDGAATWCITSAEFPLISSDALYVWGWDREDGQGGGGGEGFDGWKAGQIVTLRARRLGEDPAIWFGLFAWTVDERGRWTEYQAGLLIDVEALSDQWREVRYRLEKPVDGRLYLELRAYASGLATSRVELDGVSVSGP